MQPMKRLLNLAAVLIVSASAFSQHSLVKKWETDSTLKTPESVYYDASNKVLYVSNIGGAPDARNGSGSIGKVSLDGKVIAAEWVPGLNAPKGMALVNNTLWVADIDELVTIDIKSGKINNRIKIEGATFLNDVAADEKGTIYVTDSHKKQLWKVENNKPVKMLDNLQGPNGVLVHNKEIYVLDSGTLLKVNKDNTTQKLAEGMEGHTDGIENVQGNEFIVSCWQGVIYYVNADGSTQKLIDTREEKINSADIGYDPKTRMVYVPTFFRNNVVAYELK